MLTGTARQITNREQIVSSPLRHVGRLGVGLQLACAATASNRRCTSGVTSASAYAYAHTRFAMPCDTNRQAESRQARM